MICHYCPKGSNEHPEDYIYRHPKTKKLVYPLCCLSCAYFRYATKKKESPVLTSIELAGPSKRKSNNPKGRPASLTDPKTIILRIDGSDYLLLKEKAKAKKISIAAAIRSILLPALAGSILPPEVEPKTQRKAKKIVKAKPK